MAYSDELLELIDRYIDNRMDSQEREAFQQRMEEDAALKTYVEDLLSLHTSIVRIEMDAFKKKLEAQAAKRKVQASRGQDLSSQAKVVPFYRRRWLGVAAVGAILIVAIFLINNVVIKEDLGPPMGAIKPENLETIADSLYTINLPSSDNSNRSSTFVKCSQMLTLKVQNCVIV